MVNSNCFVYDDDTDDKTTRWHGDISRFASLKIQILQGSRVTQVWTNQSGMGQCSGSLPRVVRSVLTLQKGARKRECDPAHATAVLLSRIFLY